MATFAGLEQREGQWYDPHDRTFLSNNHSRVRQAHEEMAAQQQMQMQLAQIQQPMVRDFARMENERAVGMERSAMQQQQIQQQAAMIEERLPNSIRVLEERKREIDERLPDELTGAAREKEVMEILTSDINMKPYFDDLNSAAKFNNAHAGMLDTRAFQSAPSSYNAGVADGIVGSFSDNVQMAEDGTLSVSNQQGQQFNRPPSAEEANQTLDQLKAQLPADGTSEQRRAAAREMGIENEILQLHTFVRQASQQPQGFTLDQMGITPPSPIMGPGGQMTDRDGQPIMARPLTPEQRGFVQLPGGSYRHGSNLGGVPGLEVMRQLDQNRAGRPTEAELGFPDRSGPRFGTLQNADGTWTGMGNQMDQRGFSSEEEAREWSIANTEQAPPPSMPSGPYSEQPQSPSGSLPRGSLPPGSRVPSLSPPPFPTSPSAQTPIQPFRKGGISSVPAIGAGIDNLVGRGFGAFGRFLTGKEGGNPSIDGAPMTAQIAHNINLGVMDRSPRFTGWLGGGQDLSNQSDSEVRDNLIQNKSGQGSTFNRVPKDERRRLTPPSTLRGF